MVRTCGPAGGVTRLAGLGLGRMNLSIRLMPVNRTHGLSPLAAELRTFPRRKSFVLGVNYRLIPGQNDLQDDALRTADLQPDCGVLLYGG